MATESIALERYATHAAKRGYAGLEVHETLVTLRSQLPAFLETHPDVEVHHRRCSCRGCFARGVVSDKTAPEDFRRDYEEAAKEACTGSEATKSLLIVWNPDRQTHYQSTLFLHPHISISSHDESQDPERVDAITEEHEKMEASGLPPTLPLSDLARAAAVVLQEGLAERADRVFTEYFFSPSFVLDSDEEEEQEDGFTNWRERDLSHFIYLTHFVVGPALSDQTHHGIVEAWMTPTEDDQPAAKLVHDLLRSWVPLVEAVVPLEMIDRGCEEGCECCVDRSIYENEWLVGCAE